MKSPYPEIPFDEALALVLAAVKPMPPVLRPLDDAIGLVLAGGIVADAPMPPFAASSKDGFAVRAEDGVAPRRLVGSVVAGQVTSTVVGLGMAMGITTGAPLPPGADAVVMVEDTELVGGPDSVTDRPNTLLVHRAASRGENVRRAGEDYGRDDTLVPAGTVLVPAAMGLAASVGAAQVSVYPRPRVAVFSTGDELVDAHTLPGPGQIRDANRIALVAAAEEAGAEVVRTGSLRDAAADLDLLNNALAEVDAVITSGGVSMGHLDLVKPWLASTGEVHFGRARIKPGKPMTFGLVRGTPVFALPGFPVSTLVCFELFVRPALRRLAGHDAVTRPIWDLSLDHDLVHPADRTEFVRARVWLGSDGRPHAAITGAQTSGRLLSLSGANALLRLPEGSEVIKAGEVVAAMVLGEVHEE